MTLVAASVMTMAARPLAVSSNPRSSVMTAPRRRASDTSVGPVRDTTAIRSLPQGNDNARALARFGGQLEVVRQPLGASQAEPQTVACGVAILQCQRGIDDASALVFEG